MLWKNRFMWLNLKIVICGWLSYCVSSMAALFSCKEYRFLRGRVYILIDGAQF